MPWNVRWTAFVERHYRGILLGSAALAALCMLSLTRLRLDIDVFNMLPRGASAFDDFKSFVRDFGELNQLVVLLDGADLLHLERFADEMANRLRQAETVQQVQSHVDVDALRRGLFARHLYVYIPEAKYAEIAARLTSEAIETQVKVNRAILSAPFDLTAARAIADDPLGFQRLAAGSLADAYGGVAPEMSSGYFSAADDRALVFFVRPRASGFDVAFSERLLREAHAAAEGARSALDEASGIRVAYTGSYVYALEDAGTLQGDIARYTVLALVAVLAIFYAGYRDLRILPFVAYPLLLTTLVTFALSLLLFRELNAVSLCFAAILYGLAVDSMIYYYCRLLEERGAGPDLAAAVARTLGGLGLPDFTSSATTAAAFLAIGLSVLTAVSQFGILTAVGMMVSTTSFFVLYPAMTFALRKRIVAAAAAPETTRLERLARATERHAVGVTVAAAAVALVALYLAAGVELDVALDRLRPSDSEAVRVQDEIAHRFGAHQASAAVVVRRGDLDEALTVAETLAAKLRSYGEAVDGAPSVASVQSIEGALPSASTQRARLRRFNELPRREAAEDLRAALARNGFAGDKFTGFLDAFARPRDDAELIRYGDPDLAPLASLIHHHVQAHGGEFIVATYFEAAPGVTVRTVAERLHADLHDTVFSVASRALLEDELASVLRRELFWFCVFGVAGNLLLLWIAFRRVRTAVAVLAPTALVVVGLYAGMSVAGVPLDPVNLIVTPLLFGVGVDYGVYIAARSREIGEVPRALRFSGRPLVLSALSTVAGFGLLALSHYPFLASMGLLAGIGLSLCVVLSLVLLPALLAITRAP